MMSEKSVTLPEIIDAPANWQRASVMAIIQNMVLGFTGIFRFYMELGGLGVLVYGLTKSLPTTILSVLVMAILIIVVKSVTAYWFYKYRVSSDGVEIRSGVFKRHHLHIPFNRVQQASRSQPFYYKWFGQYTDVSLDTAGEKGSEALIPAMTSRDADSLYHLIHQAKGQRVSERVDHPNVDVQPEKRIDDDTRAIIVKQHNATLLLHGLCRNKILWFIAAGFGFYKNIEPMIPKIMEKAGINEDLLTGFQSGHTKDVLVLIGALALAYISVVLLLCALNALAKYFNLTLSRTNDGYVCEQGLLSKVETRVKSKRVQWLLIEKNMPERWLNRQSVTLAQYGESILFPGASNAQLQSMMKSVMPEAQQHNVQYKRVHFIYVLKRLLTHVLPFALLSPIFEHILHQPAWSSGSLMVATVLTFVFLLRWYRYGYAQDAQFFYIREGRLNEKRYIIEKFKLQGTSFTQSAMMRYFGLCTVRLSFAIRGFTLPYMSQKDGELLIGSGLKNVVDDKRSWM
jgi:putative membrane protein